MNFNSRANLIATAIFIPLAMLATSAISYYDEGTYRAYNGFLDFIIKGGVDSNDLIMWTIIFTLGWLGLFNFQVRYQSLEKRIGRRILVALALSPAILLIGIVSMVGIIKLIHLTLG